MATLKKLDTTDENKVFDFARIKSLDGAFIPEELQKRLGIEIDTVNGKIVFVGKQKSIEDLTPKLDLDDSY